MSEYPEPYTALFNAMTDALAALEVLNIGMAKDIMRTAQQAAEELYLSEGE